MTQAYLADSSVIVAAALHDETDHLDALALLDAAASGAVALVATDLARIELAAAVLRASRRGRLRPERVSLVLATLDAAPITFVPVANLANVAVDFAAAHGTSLYDALPALLANRLGVPLVTTDQRLKAALTPAQTVLGPTEVLRHDR